MIRLNNKGYMLVEIILASVIAFGIVYFIFDLTINLKNKNEDLMVIALTQTDKTIIMNGLMSNITDVNFCDEINISGRTIMYGDNVIDIVNDYAEVGNLVCNSDEDSPDIKVKIPIRVKQLAEENFDININYFKGDIISPTCKVDTISGSEIKFVVSDNVMVSYYGFDSSYEGGKSDTATINGEGDITMYLKDSSGNTGSCSVSVTLREDGSECLEGYQSSLNYCYLEK